MYKNDYITLFWFGVKYYVGSRNRMLTDKEVLEFIESKPHKLIVMSGPTQCGKT